MSPKLKAKLEQIGGLIERGYFLRLLARLLTFGRHNRRSVAVRTANEILAEIMPARPQVAAHQRSAALHLQLANEINWTGPRFRHPQSWRGR